MGSKAETVYDRLPTIAEANPRSWVFSTAGDKMVVGYIQGSLQVQKNVILLITKQEISRMDFQG